MDLHSGRKFFPQESPLLLAPEPISSTALLNEFTRSTRNIEDSSYSKSLDLPANDKESCTLDLGLEIECLSEPSKKLSTPPKTSCAPDPESSTDNSKQPDGATNVSAHTNFTTLQPLHLHSPSTSATAVSSGCAKNLEKTCDSLAHKLVPRQRKSDSSETIIMVSANEMDSLKRSKKKSVVCSVKLARPKVTKATSKIQTISHTSSSSLPTPLPKPSHSNTFLNILPKVYHKTAAGYEACFDPSQILILPSNDPKNMKKLPTRLRPIAPKVAGAQNQKSSIGNDKTSPQTLGSVASAIDGRADSQIKVKGQLGGTGDSGANEHVTAFQWHRPCFDPLQNCASSSSNVVEQEPVPENSILRNYLCAQSPASTESKIDKEKPETAESVLVKNDSDFAIIDQNSIHSVGEPVLQSENIFYAEPAVKTELPSEFDFHEGPSISASLEQMDNDQITVETERKYTVRSVLGLCDNNNDTCNCGNLCSTSTDSCTLEKQPVYPNAQLKWNLDRIQKIQRGLKRRLKKKENGQINLSVKRKTSSEETTPKKVQKLNDSCNQATTSGQRVGHCSSLDSSIGEVLSNVLRDCIVRKTIQDCYLKKVIPSIQMIHDACSDSGLELSEETLEQYLKSIGFNWFNCSSGRLLVEDPRFTTKRIEYLDQLEAHSGKNFVYIFASDLVAMNSKWRTYPHNAKDVLHSSDSTVYIVLHAMNNTSLIDDGLLVLTLDRDELNTLISSWLKNVVLPEVPKGSVVILSEEIFELTVKPVERLHMGHSKAKIIAWLKAHKVSSVKRDLPKAVLLSKAYDVVVPKISVCVQTIRECGFETLFLPKHHKDLNPMEFLWQDIFDRLNKNPNVKESNFEDFVENEFSCPQTATSVVCQLVRKFEETYRDFDLCFDELFDSMMSIVGPVDDQNLKAPRAKTVKPSKSSPEKLPCPVCQNPATLTDFRCSECKHFWKGLIRKYKKGKTLPVCKMYFHVKSRPSTCHGCRRNQYELEFLKTYPNQALPLPPVTFEGDIRSRTIPYKTYQGTSKSKSSRS